MKTLVRLVVAAVFLSGAAGACLVAYIVGYAEGLGVRAKTSEPPTVVYGELPPNAELRKIEVHAAKQE